MGFHAFISFAFFVEIKHHFWLIWLVHWKQTGQSQKCDFYYHANNVLQKHDWNKSNILITSWVAQSRVIGNMVCFQKSFRREAPLASKHSMALIVQVELFWTEVLLYLHQSIPWIKDIIYLSFLNPDYY